MFPKFQTIWNIARFVVIVIGGILFCFKCHAHGFAPMLDVKGPSKFNEQLKDHDLKAKREANYKKYQNVRDEEFSRYDEDGNRRDGDSNGMDRNDIDGAEVINYERDNCG